MDTKEEEQNEFIEQKYREDILNGHDSIELQECLTLITPKTKKSNKTQILDEKSKIDEKTKKDREKSAQILNEIKLKIDNGNSSDIYSSAEESDSDDESKFLCCCFNQNLKLNNSTDQAEREKFKKNLKNYRLRNRILTLIVIFIILTALGYLGYYIKNFRYKYQFLTELDKKIVHEYPVRYANFEVRFKDLFPVGSEGYFSMDRDLIKKMIRKEVKIDFDDENYKNLRKFIELKWESLVEPFRLKILTSNCSFQGENLNFGELYKEYPEAFNKLSNSDILKILHNESIGIGQMNKIELNFYIERKFVEQKVMNLALNNKLNRNLSKINRVEIKNTSDKLESIKQQQLNRTQRSVEVSEPNKLSNNYKSLSNKLDDPKLTNFERSTSSIDFNDFDILNEPQSEDKVLNFDKMVENSQNYKLLILSDKSGSGKTTTLKQLALNFKQKFPKYWISYFEVRNFMKFMNRNGKITNIDSFLLKLFIDSCYSFTSNPQIAEFSKQIHQTELGNEFSKNDNFPSSFSQNKISKRDFADLDNKTSNFISNLMLRNYTKFIPSNFEMEILKLAYRSNKTFIFWDGFDEISPIYSKFMANVINEISIKTDNIQFVSTIPENFDNFLNQIHENNFQENLEAAIYKFNPIGDLDREIYLKNLLIFKNSSIKIEENKMLNSFNSHFDFNSPLMLQIIADVMNENKKITRKNGAVQSDISNFKALNLYEVFEKFFKIKIDKWTAAIQPQNSTKFHSILNVFRVLAFKYEMSILSSPIYLKLPKLKIFNDLSNCINKYDQNFNVFAKFDQDLINSKTINDKVLQLGVISQQFDGSFQISHKIFNNFILAQYLIENLYNLKSCVDAEEIKLNFEFLINFVRTSNENDNLGLKFIQEYLKLEVDLKEDNLHDFTNNTVILKNELICDQNCTFLKNSLKSYFKGLLNLQKSYKNYSKSDILKNLTYCNLLDELNSTLTDDQLESFLKSPAGSILLTDIIYKYFNKSQDDQSSDNKECDENLIDEFWTKIENLPEKIQIDIFKNSILRYFDGDFIHSNSNLLKTLLSQSENYISSQNISEMINNNNLIHKSSQNIKNFEVMWMFYVKHEKRIEKQKEVLLKSDGWKWKDSFKDNNANSNFILETQDNLRYLASYLAQIQTENFNGTINEHESFYSKLKFVNQTQFDPFYSCFDQTSFKILHMVLLTSKTVESVDSIMNIYDKYFNESEMRQIIINSGDFFLYFASFSDPEVCEEFSVFLKILFLFHEQKLQDFLNRKSETVPLNLIDFMRLYNTDLTCAKLLYNTPKAIKQFKENFREENVAMGNSGFYLMSGKKLTPEEVLKRFKNAPQTSNNNTPKGDWSKIDKNLMKSLA